VGVEDLPAEVWAMRLCLGPLWKQVFWLIRRPDNGLRHKQKR
jgi:hypothetical protein